MRPLDDFKARWVATMPVPYEDVINLPVTTDTLPPIWGTGLLQSHTREDVSLGSNPHVEESGEILAALFAHSGTGANVLDAAVAALRDNFHGFMTEDCTLQFRAVGGPSEMEPMAEGEWWRLTFLVTFIMWSRRTEPVGG